MKWSDYYQWMKQPLPSQAEHLPVPLPHQFERDSRAIETGDWYVPLKGEHFDGHTFIDAALGQGAAGFFYELAHASTISNAILARGLPVPNTLAALQSIAQGWRLQLGPTGHHQQQDALTLMALTGSSGKTTTKEMMAAILREAGHYYAPKASFNNELGVPLTLLALKPEHRYAISEFGARTPGNIRFLCELARPNIVALINAGSAHVGVFGSYENLLRTKAEIFQYSDPQAVGVANRDQEAVYLAGKKYKKHLITFGSHQEADVQILSQKIIPVGHAKEQTLNPHGTHSSLEVVYRVFTETLTVNFIHYHEAYAINGAAAIAMTSAAGVPLAKVKSGLEQFRGIAGRFQIHQHRDADGREITVVDDAYNANPHSMMVSLRTFGKLFTGRKLLVLGDMLELGTQSRAEHEHIGTYCAQQVKPALLITVGEESKALALAAMRAGMDKTQVQSYDHVDDLLEANLPYTELADAVLVKGSNGLKLSRLIERLSQETRSKG